MAYEKILPIRAPGGVEGWRVRLGTLVWKVQVSSGEEGDLGGNSSPWRRCYEVGAPEEDSRVQAEQPEPQVLKGSFSALQSCE